MTRELTKHEKEESLHVSEQFDFNCERHVRRLKSGNRVDSEIIRRFTRAMKEFNRILSEE